MSADYFLGVPFNIASCALLLEIVARVTGYKPKWLDITTVDSHIYEDHMDQVREQLSRTEFDLPKLKIKPWTYSSDDGMMTYQNFVTAARMSDSGFGPIDKDAILEGYVQGALTELARAKSEWFTLEGYQSHAGIKAPMAV